MSLNSRTTLRRSEPSPQLLERLLSQFPELTRDEAMHAAAGVTALPAVDPAEPAPAVTAPPRHRA